MKEYQMLRVIACGRQDMGRWPQQVASCMNEQAKVGWEVFNVSLEGYNASIDGYTGIITFVREKIS